MSKSKPHRNKICYFDFTSTTLQTSVNQPQMKHYFILVKTKAIPFVSLKFTTGKKKKTAILMFHVKLFVVIWKNKKIY